MPYLVVYGYNSTLPMQGAQFLVRELDPVLQLGIRTPQLKIPHVAAKTQRGQINIEKKKQCRAEKVRGGISRE